MQSTLGHAFSTEGYSEAQRKRDCQSLCSRDYEPKVSKLTSRVGVAMLRQTLDVPICPSVSDKGVDLMTKS